MNIRLFILSLACMACVVPSHGGLITAKLLAKKAIGAGAAIIAGKAALIKEGLASLGSIEANRHSQDCDSDHPIGAVDKIIETKKKLISDIFGLKQKIISDVVDEKHQFIGGLSKPEVIVVKDVPQAPLFIDGPAPPLVNFHPLVEFPSFPPHQVVELPQFPPQYLDVALNVPPRPAFPQRLYPAPPPPPYIHGGPIHSAEPIPIRIFGGDCE